jgi:proteasome lid subunit RPN8/RPN11
MTIVIGKSQLKIIYDHAENIYPEECCGILLGKIDQLCKSTIEVIPSVNAWVKPELVDDLNMVEEINRTKHSRYTIAPEDIFRAQKRARDLHLDIIGFFHSHPDYPAIPSTCDRDRAWEIYSYPIVSVINGKVSLIKSWVLDSKRIFQEEEIQTILPQ